MLCNCCISNQGTITRQRPARAASTPMLGTVSHGPNNQDRYLGAELPDVVSSADMVDIGPRTAHEALPRARTNIIGSHVSEMSSLGLQPAHEMAQIVTQLRAHTLCHLLEARARATYPCSRCRSLRWSTR